MTMRPRLDDIVQPGGRHMQPSVLLVDDDRSLLDALKRRLHGEAYRILCAGTGDEALQLLSTEAVDVVLSDEHMPSMSGVDLLTEVHRRWPDVVTLMLSGRASAGTIVRALNQGQIFRFLIKPCDADEIAECLRQALTHKRVIERCRQILPASRRMHELLVAAERLQPGILRRAEAELKKVVVRADDFQSLEQLADRLAVEIRSASEYMPATVPASHPATALVERGVDPPLAIQAESIPVADADRIPD